jgi:hypothetical protein
MYDSNTQAVSDKLMAASSVVFTQETIDSILSLVSTSTDPKIVIDTVALTANGTVNVTPGTEIVFVSTSDSQLTKLAVNGNAPAVFFQGAGGVEATIGAAPPVASADGKQSAAVADPDAIQRVVVGTAGADTIIIADRSNTKVIAGDKDVVKAGSGHTVVVAAQGSSTVIGGQETIVEARGDDDDFSITVVNGHARISNAATKVSVDLSGVQYVQLDNKQALIFAENAKQAAIANLYQAVLGRTADYDGLDYWFDMADRGVSVKSIAQGFMASSEYKLGALNNAQFVDALYHGMMGRDADAAGAKYWVDALGAGVSRADVATAFAEAAATSTTEVSIVGSVTIVPGFAHHT